MIELVHRGPGWCWPLRDHHHVEAWEGMQLVAEIPGALIRQMIAHYVTGAELQGQLQGFLRRPPARILPGNGARQLLGLNGRRLRGALGTSNGSPAPGHGKKAIVEARGPVAI